MPLTVDRTSPDLDDASSPVLLNDPLTVYFSAPIQRLSVTPDSFAVLDENGHQVAGRTEIGSDWVTFLPEPPMQADLQDGSFRPGCTYHLVVAGAPRLGAVRGADGAWLANTSMFRVRVADHHQRPPGLPSILRPPPSELPFMLRTELPLQVAQVAADAPRIRLHFTRPVLPTSLHPGVFEVNLLRRGIEELVPRSVRVMRSPLDNHPGCSIEIDLGALPSRVGSDAGTFEPLRAGDPVSVAIRSNSGLCDYAGSPPLPVPPMMCLVVDGESVPLCAWPVNEREFAAADPLLPGFEFAAGSIRARARVEAGTGRLGLFRPQRDVTLRPGVSFDRGDGVQVQSSGPEFDFLAVDVPFGVTVTVHGSTTAPVRLRSAGGVRVTGELRIEGDAAALPPTRLSVVPVDELVNSVPVAVVAAGDVWIEGRILTTRPVDPDRCVLLLATAGRMRLRGELPFQSLLALEAGRDEARARIDGIRGQSRVLAASFTDGAAPGADYPVQTVLPWRQMPAYEDSARVQMIASSGLQMSWQTAPADALDASRPDVGPGRIGSWQSARDGDLVLFAAGSFVRFELNGQVRAGADLPKIDELRLIE